ncbi:MAG: hypothetical protein CBE41_03545 [Gammaproteobacteria bacterium TMED281]|nr:MAG: hypothetical protein CBE41_03545 [Gammaproteobacteria bacterium TMED281]
MTLLSFCVSSFAGNDFFGPQPLTPLPGIGLSEDLTYQSAFRNQYTEAHYDTLEDVLQDSDPSVVIRHISSIYQSIAYDGSGSYDHFSNHQKWGLYANHFQYYDPIRLSPLTQSVVRFGHWDVMWMPGSTLFPFSKGVLRLMRDNALSNLYQQYFTGYASDGDRYFLYQSRIGKQDKGLSFQFFREVNDGERYNFSGDTADGQINYTHTTPDNIIEVNAQLRTQQSDFNYSIPIELNDAHPNQFYVAPSDSEDTIHRIQMTWQHSANDHRYLTSTSQYQYLDFHKKQAHPLNIKTCTSGDFPDNTICLNDKALVDQNLNTITRANVGSPRTFASLMNADEKSSVLDQSLQYQQFSNHTQWLVGFTGSFNQTDYTGTSQLASLTDKRVATVLTNSGQEVQIDGTKATNTSAAVLDPLTPVDLQTEALMFSLFGVYQNQVNPKTDAFFSANIKGTTYDVDNQSQLSLTSGLINSNHQFARLNPSAALIYHVDERNDVYAHLFQLNQPPSLLALYCSDENNACYWPKTFYKDGDLSQTVTTGINIGTKGHQYVDNINLRWTVDTHFNHLNNDIVLIPTDWMKGFSKNIDQTQNYGLNARVNVVTDRFNTTLAYRYLNASFQSDFTVPAVYDIGTNQSVSSGDPMPGVPNHSIRLTSIYDWSKTFSFFGGIIGVGSSEYYGNFNGNHGTYNYADDSGTFTLGDVPGFGLLNLGVTWKPNRNLHAFFRIDNVFDKHYYTDGSYGQAPSPAMVQFSELGDSGSGAVVGIKDPQFVSQGLGRFWRISFKLAI